MIRLHITEADLERLVDAAVPNWRNRAGDRTKKFVTAGRYDETAGIWSEVKSVYMELQHNKCAYCERKLAAPDHGGSVEHDLEHFRPKSSVEEWPDGSRFKFATGGAHPTGYYWLAYHLLNYVVACKKCNSGLKSNYFPVAGPRGSASATPADLRGSEQPFLVCPLGDLDDDPATVIAFDGHYVVPAKRTGPRRWRADVTIHFFRLNTREELLRERAEVVAHLDHYLGTINSKREPAGRKAEAREAIIRMLRPSSPHTACVNAFAELYRRDHRLARAIAEKARQFLRTLR
jgi:hypothetical protein